MSRRIVAAVACAALLAGCTGVPAAFGPDVRTARTNADVLFGALAARFDNVQRAPKFYQARSKLGRYALSPSGVYRDSSVWTGSAPDSTRILTLAGTRTTTGYVFAPRPLVPPPSVSGDSRHIIRLRKHAEGEYEWLTNVEHAVGTVRAADVARVATAFIGGAEQQSEPAVRAEYRTVFPRTTRVLGELFSLETVRLTPLPDRSTSVELRFRLHRDRLQKTRPNFAKYIEKYVEPARYKVRLRDPRGTTWLYATADDGDFLISYRSRGGELVALAGAPQPMPDSLQLEVDFSAKFMIFRVGVSSLVGDLVAVRTADERGWSMRFRREPDWHLPLAVNNLIRTSLRHPFSGDGITFRLTVRDTPGGKTMVLRELRLRVQESAIVRWLGGLGSSAMSDFAGRAEAEENRYLFDVLTALGNDCLAALPEGE